MPETYVVPPRALADGVDARDLVRRGQLDAKTLRSAADYDDSGGAPTSTRAGLLWVPASGKWAPRDVLLASDYGAANGVAELDSAGLLPAGRLPASAVTTAQRGPIGGTNTQTLTTATYSIDATTFLTRRYTLTGNPTFAVPTQGADGQRIVFWLGASGAARTAIFASGYEVSPQVPSRSIVIASGTWEMVEVECRNGTWRLVQTDQLLYAPADIGAAPAAAGLPTGGASGAVLVKNSSSDYDAAWATRGVSQLRATASQTCSAANTWYSVAFAAEDFDDDNGHDNATNNTRWTAPRACVVKASASIVWVGSQSVTNPQRIVQFTRNGVAVPGSPGNASYVATGLTQVIQPMFVTLAAGQYLELQMRSAAAGAQIYADSSTCSIMTVEIIR